MSPFSGILAFPLWTSPRKHATDRIIPDPSLPSKPLTRHFTENWHHLAAILRRPIVVTLTVAWERRFGKGSMAEQMECE